MTGVKKTMTPLRESVLRYIEQHIADKKYPPTIREINEATKTLSTSSIQKCIKRLAEDGYITWEPNLARAITRTSKKWAWNRDIERNKK